MRDESVLDDPDRLQAADQDGMLRTLASAGPQLRRTIVSAAEAGVVALTSDGPPRAVVVVGTGVAALAADAFAALAGPSAVAPIVVMRTAELPRWVGTADLVVGLSPSGAGLEALTAANVAAARGARVVGVGADETPLAALVARARGPYVAIGSWQWRRATFWPLLTGLLCLADAAGAVRAPGGLLEQAAARLDDAAIRCRPDSESVVNPAKSLALRLLDAVPVIWAGSALTAVAAHRFSDSLAGMAGTAAAYWLLDGNPQALGLFGGPRGALREVGDIFADPVAEPAPRRLHPVLLRDEGHQPPLDRAVELADYYHLPITELAADDGPPLLGLAQLIGELDITAAYLGLAEGLNPARETGDGALPS